ncbi:fibronectin type III domain-containing protein [Dactylosporangium sp. NPDC000521]|uniref:fibronectin type III domain-containing protein n=1 Tax=Dactylosporangium sp. NPDC000521 TaxID=3363975 RepID=UPI00368A3BEF
MTRSVPRPARRAVRAARAAQAARAARAGLVLAAAGIVVVGATGGTAFAAPGQFNHPSPDGGAEVRSHGVHATGGNREANDRKMGKIPAPAKGGTAAAAPKSKTGTTKAAPKPKTGTTKAAPKSKAGSTGTATKAKAKAKAKAQRNKTAHKTTAKPPRKAPAGSPSSPGGTALATPVQQVAAAPTAVTVTPQSPTSLKISWKVNISETGIVDHFEATALEDATKHCRTRTNAATSCIVSSLTQGATYTFAVRAIAVPGSGARSSVLSAMSAPVTVAGSAATQAITPGAAPATGPARDPHQTTPASTGKAQTTHGATPTANGAPLDASAAAQHSNPTAQTSSAAAQTANGAAQTAGGAAQTAGGAAQAAGGAAQTANGAALGANAAAQHPNRAAQTSNRAARHRTAQDSTRWLSGADKGRDTAQASTATQHHTANGFGGLLGLPNGTTGTAVVAAATAETRGGHQPRTGVLALLGLGALAVAGLATAAVTRVRRHLTG